MHLHFGHARSREKPLTWPCPRQGVYAIYGTVFCLRSTVAQSKKSYPYVAVAAAGFFSSLSPLSCFCALIFHTNEGRKDIFYLTLHSTHFIYGYMASDIW